MADADATAGARATVQFAAAADRVRDTARWLIVSFAAVGGILVAGSQLSSLGTLGPTDLRFWLALAGAVVALTAVVAAVAAVSAVLVIEPLSLEALAHESGYQDIRHRLQADKILVPYAEGVPRIYDRLREADKRQRAASDRLLEASRRALSEHTDATSSATSDDTERARQEAERKRLHASAEIETDNERIESLSAQNVLAVAAILRINSAFDRAKRRVIYLTAAAALGIMLFAAAANPKRSDSPTAVVTGKKTTVTFTAAGRNALKSVLGGECAPKKLSAVVLGTSPGGIEVVTLPEGRCSSVRVVVSPTLGSVS